MTVHYLIQIIAHVAINIYFVMTVLHVSVAVGNRQGDHIQRNT